MGRGPKPGKGKAKPAVSRKSPRNEDSKVRNLEKRLTEALKDKAEAREQQTATSEILRVIAGSPTDVQPVFDAIAATAARLCDATFSVVVRSDRGLLHLVAMNNMTPEETAAYRSLFPRLPGRHFIMGRAFLDGRPVHVDDVLTDPDYDPHTLEVLQRAAVYRTCVGIPILRDGVSIGVIGCSRRAVKPFTATQIELVRTFADQAVIAIENVRLFNETKEALERQTATAEILRIISSSPTDLLSVMEAVAENAARLCDSSDAHIFRLEGDVLRRVAYYGVVPVPALTEALAQPLTRGRATGRAVIDRRTIHIHDMAAEIDGEFPDAKLLQQATGQRTTLATPLLREGIAIGVILMRRLEVRPFSDTQIRLLETFADQAVIAIENARLFQELQEKNGALTAAHTQVIQSLEQQTATSEILRVIASSPTDVQPVFDAIVASAVRLCRGNFGAVHLYDGELLHLVAHHNIAGEALDYLRQLSPRAPGMAVLERRVILIADFEADPEVPEAVRIGARLRGSRSNVTVAMLRDNSCLGVIVVGKREPGLFPDEQVQLLQTFADQAVIAIENVRLFKELQEKNQALTQAHAQVTESLEQQTATSGILRVISQSPTELQPVFDTIVRNAVQLCGATYGSAYRIDGDVIFLVAEANLSGEGWERFRTSFPRPLRDGGVIRDVVESRRLQYLENIDAYPFSEAARALFATNRTQSLLTVPMIRQGQVIGAFSLFHPDLSGFPDGRIDLVRTFADQAVIAIENVRLFTELQEKNKALTEAHAQVTESLEQQTATSEILRVISRSPTDTQPVFDAIARNAVALCGGIAALVLRYDGEMLHIAGHHEMSPDAVERVERAFPRHPGRDYPPGRALLERHVVHIPDLQAATEFTASTARQRGVGSMLVVPLLREGEAIGVISLARDIVGPFSAQQIEVLQTFADQAVIAIENVRLFKELQARTQQLTRSVEQLTALREVGHAVSSSLDLETVLNTIVARAVQLAGAHSGTIWEYDAAAEEFVLRITLNVEDPELRANPNARVRRGEGAVGRLAISQRPVQIPDITHEGAYEGRLRDSLVGAGTRALLAIPLLHEDQLLGGLVISRRTPGEFPAEVVELLASFATQSALALQNARLFLEIGDKSRQLEAASQHKSEFLANMSHELRTPLNAIIGFSEVLTERMFGELNEKQEEYSKDIHASGQHLLSLINDILDLSKIEAGRMELELSDFHLPTALDSALTLVRERAGRRSIALHLSVDDRLGQIQADERKVRQVVLNLLSNAIKFTPEGGRIEVLAAPKDGFVEVSVIDTGVGIAPEDQEAVFEEFRQVGTADKKVEGTGLGLTLCRKFVELHGGKIWVKSQLGAGSTFTFTIPTGM